MTAQSFKLITPRGEGKCSVKTFAKILDVTALLMKAFA
jgi:hypothetical protein